MLCALSICAPSLVSIAIIGIGQSPAQREPAPSAATISAAQQRIAAGGAAVARGRDLFADEGCDRCHSIAAIGADGKLGPRLDTIDDADDADDIVESIVEPREDTVDGYPEQLMPTDYARRLNDAEIDAFAAFITAAAGSEDDEGEDSNSGKGSGDGDGDRGRRGCEDDRSRRG